MCIKFVRASKCLHSGIILFIHYIYSGRSHQLAPLEYMVRSPYKNTAHMRAHFCMQFAHMLHVYQLRPAYMQNMCYMLKFDHVRTVCRLHTTQDCSAAYKSSKPYIYAAHMQYVSSWPSLHMCCICAVGKVQAHPAHVL